jgi:hypothetical protein
MFATADPARKEKGLLNLPKSFAEEFFGSHAEDRGRLH